MEKLPPIPYVTLDQANMLYNLGEWLIEDDRHDIGYTTYTNRKNHYYHGKKAPYHESPIHHWQIGGILLLLSQMAGALALVREMNHDHAHDHDHNVDPAEESDG